MTFTAEPNIGPYLVEATPTNLLEHIDEHVKFLRECKITFTGSIGRGDIPHTKSAMTLLNNIDVLIAGEEADKEVLRFNTIGPTSTSGPRVSWTADTPKR